MSMIGFPGFIGIVQCEDVPWERTVIVAASAHSVRVQTLRTFVLPDPAAFYSQWNYVFDSPLPDPGSGHELTSIYGDGTHDYCSGIPGTLSTSVSALRATGRTIQLVTWRGSLGDRATLTP